ncbi:MAG: YdcF family protein [Alphaproteobacteria bacterium]|nr:YdcF family protein [Alphaproteobacteria bacterium]
MLKFIRIALQVIGALTVLAVIAAALTTVVLGQWLQYQPPIEKADYLVPLAGDDNRLLTAIELYKQGYAPILLLSNAHVPPPGRAEKLQSELGHAAPHPYKLRQEILDHFGVPAQATAEFGQGHISTVGEAESLRQLLGDRPVKVLLVTSPFHARRAAMIFKSVMPRAQFLVAVTPEYRLSDPWWSEQTSALLTMSEAMKLTFFWLGGAFRTAAPAR